MRQFILPQAGRHASLGLFLLLGLAGLLPGPHAGETAFVRVSPRDPRYFELSDGRPYIPVGLNMIAPDGKYGTDETNGLRRLDEWMARLSANGGNYVRVWLSSPFWDVEHERCGVFDESKARRIDAMLDLARRHGIRVKMTLEHFRSIEGQGRQKWAHKPLHLTTNGGTATNLSDFFAGQSSRQQFQKKLDWYAQRYGDDPAVYGWELWNEINAVNGGNYMDWTEAMLAELHRRFPKNLAMQSLGSFDGDYCRKDYKRLTVMPGNDAAQVHRYLDLGAPLVICRGPVDVLAADAVRELLAQHPNRPVLLAESGAVEPQHTGPFKLYGKDTEGIILHDILFAPFFAGAAGPGQIWHWGEYVDRNILWRHFGRFAEAVKGLDPADEHFQAAMLDHPRLRVYVLKGKNTTLVWCRDRENDWKSELQDNRPPEPLRDLALNLGPLVEKNRIAKMTSYNPWLNQWGAVKTNEQGQITLPEFTRSLVVRIEQERR